MAKKRKAPTCPNSLPPHSEPEVNRLRAWLRAIAFTPHHGCLTTSLRETISRPAGEHKKALCGACKAQDALSGHPAP